MSLKKIYDTFANPTSRLFCSFLLIAFLLFPVFAGVAQEPSNVSTAPSAKIEDCDGDGLKDASIETSYVRVIVSGKTGSPALLHLKGRNFDENIYPPVIQDFGYKIASETLKAFAGEIYGVSLSGSGYTVELEENTTEKIVVRATANVSLPAAEMPANAEVLTASPVLSLIVRYTFYADSYHFAVEHVVSNLQERLVTVGNEQNGSLSLNFGPGIFMDPFGPSTILALKPGVAEAHTDVKALNAAGFVTGAFKGIGLRDQYFCVILESESPARISASAFEIESTDEKRKKQTGNVISCSLPAFNLGAKESRAFTYKVYAGPIILDQLKKHDLEQVSEYGFLSTMLLRVLQFFYNLFPNYGLAIVLLTLVVRLALYPLTLKQTKSMAQMQKIQPKVQDLKDRYKDNPQKFNEEVLKLYQKSNVNPLGGCLPLLLQLPILIALYNTIRIAVELRKTPFLWISDLSKGDPLLILPIAIAALMYYQQGKMTDPQQQQMMAFMPMFMFVITWSLPAGLLVYWFASSVIGLLQQFQANRIAAAIKEE